MSIERGVDRPTAMHAPPCFRAEPKIPYQYSVGRKFEEGLQQALKESLLLFPVVVLKAEQRLTIQKIAARRFVFGH